MGWCSKETQDADGIFGVRVGIGKLRGRQGSQQISIYWGFVRWNIFFLLMTLDFFLASQYFLSSLLAFKNYPKHCLLHRCRFTRCYWSVLMQKEERTSNFIHYENPFWVNVPPLQAYFQFILLTPSSRTFSTEQQIMSKDPIKTPIFPWFPSLFFGKSPFLMGKSTINGHFQ